MKFSFSTFLLNRIPLLRASGLCRKARFAFRREDRDCISHPVSQYCVCTSLLLGPVCPAGRPWGQRPRRVGQSMGCRAQRASELWLCPFQRRGPYKQVVCSLCDSVPACKMGAITASPSSHRHEGVTRRCMGRAWHDEELCKRWELLAAPEDIHCPLCTDGKIRAQSGRRLQSLAREPGFAQAPDSIHIQGPCRQRWLWAVGRGSVPHVVFMKPSRD